MANSIVTNLLNQPLPKYEFYSFSGNRTTVDRTATNALNANSQYRIPATDFSGAYTVNMPTTDTVDYGHYISLGSEGQLRNQASSGIIAFDRPIDLNFNGSNPVAAGNIPDVAPAIPTNYTDFVSYLSITEAQFDDLRMQPEFKIPGTNVTAITDGLGNITDTRISNTVQGLTIAPAATDVAFGGVNRAKVTEGAIFKTSDVVVGSGGKTDTNKPITAVLNRNANALNPLQQAQPQPLNPFNVLQRAGINPIFDGNDLNGFNNQNGFRPANAIQERLLALQPVDQGLSVVGEQSELNVEAARQLASTQAKLGVETSNDFARNLAALKQAQIDQGNVYQRPSAIAQARMMDGFIPMAPTLPNVSPQHSTGGGLGSAASFLENTFNGSNIEDAASKRGGSGGYIPFRMGSGSGGNTGGQSSFSGGQFSGNPQEHPQRQRRRSLAVVA